MKKHLGMSLFELLIAISIISILLGICLPIYSTYTTRAYRLEATNTLGRLSIALEQYYAMNNTYKGATLSDLKFPKTSKHYQFAITTANDRDFIVQAIPLHQDLECHVFSLNAIGEKKISGSGNVSECW